jgi:colicin import membrane protein
MELEAKRFEEWNAAHQKSFRDIDDLHEGLSSDKRLTAIRKAAEKGVQAIGEKVVAGLQENVEGTEDSIDQQMREDHVRDMVGRRHVVDPQGEPLSIIERLHGRVPDEGTAAEASVALIAKTDVAGLGPTKEEVDAAQAEQEPWAPPEDEPTPPAASGGEPVPGAAPPETERKKVVGTGQTAVNTPAREADKAAADHKTAADKAAADKAAADKKAADAKKK